MHLPLSYRSQSPPPEVSQTRGNLHRYAARDRDKEAVQLSSAFSCWEGCCNSAVSQLLGSFTSPSLNSSVSKGEQRAQTPLLKNMPVSSDVSGTVWISGCKGCQQISFPCKLLQSSRQHRMPLLPFSAGTPQCQRMLETSTYCRTEPKTCKALQPASPEDKHLLFGEPGIQRRMLCTIDRLNAAGRG